MPENAAAEGGFGLGANEAFGGQVGTGNVSASEVGGAQGSFGGGEFGGSNPAAQAAAASNAVSVAQGLFSNAGVQQGLLGMAANLSASHAPTAPGLAPGFDPEAAFGMMAPGLNPSTGGLMGLAAPDTAPTADPSGYAMADVMGINSMSPAAMSDISETSNQFGLQGVQYGLSGLAPSINPAQMGIPSVSISTAPSISAAPAAPAAPAPGLLGLTDEAAQAAASQAQSATSPAVNVAPTTNVSPATIAQDISRSTTAPATTTTAPTAYSEKGLLGRIAQDLAMGLSVNPFASREDQAAQLANKGYSQAEIQGYFGRTDATIARDAASREASQGAAGRDDIMKAETPAEAEIKKQMQGFIVPRRAFRGY